MILRSKTKKTTAAALAGVLSILAGLIFEIIAFLVQRHATRPETMSSVWIAIGAMFLAIGSMWFAIAARFRKQER